MATIVPLAAEDPTSLLQMKMFVFHAQKEQQVKKDQHQWRIVVSQEMIHMKINRILHEYRMKIIYTFLP